MPRSHSRWDAAKPAATKMTTVDDPRKIPSAWERPFRIGFALCLVPALLAVVMVSVAGMIVLAAGRPFAEIVKGSDCPGPHANPVRADGSRS